MPLVLRDFHALLETCSPASVFVFFVDKFFESPAGRAPYVLISMEVFSDAVALER